MSARLGIETPFEPRSTATPDRKRLLTIAEAAASLGIGESLFRRDVLTASYPGIETVRIGGRRLVLPSSLDAYVESIRTSNFADI